MCIKGCIIFPSNSMLKFLEDDYPWDNGGRKDRYKEEVSKPPKAMDNSFVDQTVGGEWKWY